jgi:methyltransferase (TIGR00027 family)
VDHPATQAWKQRRLAEASIAIPPSLTFVPVDFETETLADGLALAQFDPRRPAFFAWLGVTMYLTGEAITSTLDLIRSTAPGGGLVFDYAVPRASLGWVEGAAFDALAALVASAGEPFRTFFDPRQLQAMLSGMAFHSIEDFGRDELNARYFGDRSDGLRLRGGLGRMISALI